MSSTSNLKSAPIPIVPSMVSEYSNVVNDEPVSKFQVRPSWPRPTRSSRRRDRSPVPHKRSDGRRLRGERTERDERGGKCGGLKQWVALEGDQTPIAERARRLLTARPSGGTRRKRQSDPAQP